MKNYQKETENRVEFIRNCLKNAGASGIVFGNSGGKDSALVGILSKLACDNTLAVVMPCSSERNYGMDKDDATFLSKQFNIEQIVVDLSKTKETLQDEIQKALPLNDIAKINVNPRLRMTTLYSIAQTRNSLVSGTGNKCEIYMGYFTKYGDGAADINPIADLTVSEIYEFLEYLNAPDSIIKKAPSAGLYDGQTDEKEMGVSYKEIEDYISGKDISKKSADIIENSHRKTEHKRGSVILF